MGKAKNKKNPPMWMDDLDMTLEEQVRHIVLALDAMKPPKLLQDIEDITARQYELEGKVSRYTNLIANLDQIDASGDEFVVEFVSDWQDKFIRLNQQVMALQLTVDGLVAQKATPRRKIPIPSLDDEIIDMGGVEDPENGSIPNFDDVPFPHDDGYKLGDVLADRDMAIKLLRDLSVVRNVATVGNGWLAARDQLFAKHPAS